MSLYDMRHLGDVRKLIPSFLSECYAEANSPERNKG